jgi:hypothetical protein
MDSGMISKIEKARRYAEERDRVTFQSFDVVFRGEHNDYHITYQQGNWHCECDFFARRGVCSHSMAMERILDLMLKPELKTQPS